MNYLSCSVHNFNSPIPTYELCYIESKTNTVYTWEFKGNQKFMIPKFPFKNDSKILYMGNIKNAFERNARTEAEFVVISFGLRKYFQHRLISVSQLYNRKERYAELIPIKIRNAVRDMVPCRRCISSNRPANDCSRLLTHSLRKYTECNFDSSTKAIISTNQ